MMLLILTNVLILPQMKQWSLTNETLKHVKVWVLLTSLLHTKIS